MWRKQEESKAAPAPPAEARAPEPAPRLEPPKNPLPPPPPPREAYAPAGYLSAALKIKGEIAGAEDLFIDGLPVAVDQRHIDRKIDTRARHHLPLERIAMQIDDARQHQ